MSDDHHQHHHHHDQGASSCQHQHQHHHPAAQVQREGGAAQANRQFFDEHAHEQAEMPELRALAERLGPVFVAQHTFDPSATTVLDFACGSGLVSRAIAAHAKKVVGVDISPVSIDMYNAAARALGYGPERMQGVALELTGAPGELSGELFDVVVCSMAFHHLDNPEGMARVLAGHLNPGGALAIVDIESSSNLQHFKDGSAVASGAVPQVEMFDRNRVRIIFEGAGLESFAYGDAGVFEWQGAAMKLFVARGIKP
eukprot:m51a1_g8135 putative S-adenosyl-L-methionine-dependent methyltransferase (256) ;mRNA; r:9571-10399